MASLKKKGFLKKPVFWTSFENEWIRWFIEDLTPCLVGGLILALNQCKGECSWFLFYILFKCVSILWNHCNLELSGPIDCYWLVLCWHWKERLSNRAPAVDAGDTEAGVAFHQNIHSVCAHLSHRIILTIHFTPDRGASGKKQHVRFYFKLLWIGIKERN